MFCKYELDFLCRVLLVSSIRQLFIAGQCSGDALLPVPEAKVYSFLIKVTIVCLILVLFGDNVVA